MWDLIVMDRWEVHEEELVEGWSHTLFGMPLGGTKKPVQYSPCPIEGSQKPPSKSPIVTSVLFSVTRKCHL